MLSHVDFTWLTTTFGKDSGNPHIDVKESVVHEIFKDKVLINTAFQDCTSYEVSFAEAELMIRKNKLDNHKLHEKAALIADEMSENDNEELVTLWNAMIKELRTLEKLHGLSNAKEPLEQLYLDIFDEEDAEEQINNLPDIVKSNPADIWEELQVALQNTSNLAEFEWKELSDEGIFALNQLQPVQSAGIILEGPTDEEYEEIAAADDYAKTFLDFLNVQLEEYELKIVAIGVELDEYQSFACFPMQDFRLANAMLKMEELGLVCFF
ncbi:MAG TPA: hypothetical protein VM802_27020 [Chitinophaga sp.]|uniref:DUF6630 family protein n=1 Tax=Chitinophaga sp. TaxID=1869181 RepID=UPI002CA0203D|nr:hypothetical protein [Chitinophaga sp.]HVI48550.1 hypothetical protein [Chitinophaga sp.]